MSGPDETVVESAPRGTTTWAGWFAMVQRAEPERPPVRSLAELGVMSRPERRGYERLRRRWHAQFGPIHTQQMKGHVDAALRYLRANQDRPADKARGGLVFTGRAALGKTTLLNEISRQWWQEQTEEMLDEDRIDAAGFLTSGNRWVPVCNLSLSQGCTPRQLIEAVLAFYDIRIRTRDDEGRLVRMAKAAAQKSETTVLVVDEFHNLRPKNQTAQNTSGRLKHLANELSLSLLFAGIGVAEQRGLYDGLPAEEQVIAQTAGRLALHEVGPLDDRDWRGVLRAYDRSIVLAAHDPGDRDQRRAGVLEQRSGYLADRTGRVIGSLDNLVRQAVQAAVDTGVERITDEILDSIILDKQAVDHAPPALRRKRTRGAA